MPIGFERGDFGRVAEDPLPEVGRALSLPAIPVTWTRWQTREDERVCPECGPLDGLVWEEHAGPSPPLHNHCRCERVFAFVEWRARGAE
jgi:hypothetical protein